MIIDDFGYTKIADFNSIFVNEYIFGFDIPVDDIPFFQKLECYDHLCDKPPYNLIRQTLLMLEYEILKSTLIAILNEQK